MRPECQRLTTPMALLRGLLLAVLVVPLSGHAAETTEYQFGVFLGEQRIGQHRFRIGRDGEQTRVTSRAELSYRLLFVTVYRYTHEANELWRGGCLTELRSATDDNGQRFTVEATAAAGPVLTRRQPLPQRALGGDCPGSFAYWDRARLERSVLINTQTGTATPARLQRTGEETLNGGQTVRYRLDADGLAPIHLWYRASDERWVQLETERDGRRLQYRLEGTRRWPGAAIDPAGGVPAPSV